MFFINNINVEFRRRKGSKNKYRKSNYNTANEIRENVNTTRKVVSAGTNIAKEVRSWMKMFKKIKPKE